MDRQILSLTGASPPTSTKRSVLRGGTGAIEFKNGYEGKAAQAAGWDNGIELKCWVVEFTTTGYDQLTLSSKQTSGGTDPGPMDWRVDYRIGTEGNWSEVPGTDLVIANDWITGVLDNIDLPAECFDQPDVYLRWIMTSDSGTAGGMVEAAGKCKIDNILVMGHEMNPVTETRMGSLAIFPNPATEYFTVSYPESNAGVQVYDAAGRRVLEKRFHDQIVLSTLGMHQGIYFVRLTDEKGSPVFTKKLLVK